MLCLHAIHITSFPPPASQMMEEIFLHLSGSNSALPAMVQILADFATSDGIPTSLDILLSLMFCCLDLKCLIWYYNSMIYATLVLSEAFQFTPRLKGVLTRVLPILGNVKDIHRPIFANGMLF